MPKRSNSEKIRYYEEKIRKVKEREKPRSKFRRIIYSDSENESDRSTSPCNVENVEEKTSNIEDQVDRQIDDQVDRQYSQSEEDNPSSATEGILDADFLSALGDPAGETPTYGEKIHQSLAERWLPILRHGLVKENKEQLLKEFIIPENCKLLRAPTVNPEISAAITEAARSRDKKLESTQQQLGLGITAINRAMSVLFTGNDDKECKVQAIKILSDSCRILSDLHFMETQTRIKLITPALDKSFLNIIEGMERDESLFSSKLSEKIKACKAIEKQGMQIKKSVPIQKSATPFTSQPTTRPRYQGNWTAPSRFHQSSNRGGRGGAAAQRTWNTGSRPTTTAAAPTKSAPQNKPRAAQRR